MSQRIRPPLLALSAVLCVAALVIALAANCKPGEPAVSPTLSSTPTPPPTSTPVPTWTPTPTPVPTPQLPVLAGTPVPLPQVPITPENAADVVELAMWGRGEALDVTYSPDGRLLAVGTTVGIWLYDAETLEQIRFIKTDSQVHDLTFTPDSATIIAGLGVDTVASWDTKTGAHLTSLKVRESREGGSLEPAWALSVVDAVLVAVSGEHEIHLWDVEKGRLLHTLEGHTRRIVILAFSSDGSLLASCSREGVILVWDVKTGTLLHQLKGHGNHVVELAFSPNGTVLASSMSDDTVRLWDAATGTLLWTLKGHQRMVGSLAFSPDGAVLASGSLDRTVRLWDTGTGTLLQMKGCTTGVDYLSFSPDGKVLASGEMYGSARLWDVENMVLLHTLERSAFGVIDLAFSPDGATLASIEKWDGAVRLWDTKTGVLLSAFGGYHIDVSGLAVSPDGLVFVSHYHSNEVQVWNTATGQIARTLKVDTGTHIYRLALSTDGTTLAAGQGSQRAGGYRSVLIWDASTGQRLRSIDYGLWAIISIALSPTGEMVAIGTETSASDVYDVRTGEVLQKLPTGHNSHLFFSPDGTKLMSASATDTIRMWDTETWSLLYEIEPGKFYAGGRPFSPDGEMVAVVGSDGKIWFLDVETGSPLRSLDGCVNGYRPIFSPDRPVFSPDGTLLASAPGEQRTLLLCDVMAGTLVGNLGGHTSTVGFLFFSPDGMNLISGSDDGTVRLWGVPPAD